MTLIECELAQIFITESPMGPQAIVLREKGGTRALPINIGIFEAIAINRHVNGEEIVRPMTHDLLATVIGKLDGRLDRVVVNDLKEDSAGNGTFYGMLVLLRGGSEIEIDCRPSDAVALAVRLGGRIFVAEHVLERSQPQQ